MNFWDLLLSILLVLALYLALQHSFRLYKAGKLSCGGNCESCPLACRKRS